MADLYIWLKQHFTYKEDPMHDPAYTPLARDHIATLRAKA